MAAGSRFVWAGYIAFGWGLIFAGISFYWGAGGTLGVDTVWGSATTGVEQSPGLRAAVWVTGVMKVVAALLAIALASDRSWRLPRRALIVLGSAAFAILSLYGGVNVFAEALTAAGVIKPTSVDWKPLLWHLYVWDMSFLVWGILFGVATWNYTRRPMELT